jgi:hypothetical protein
MASRCSGYLIVRSWGDADDYYKSCTNRVYSANSNSVEETIAASRECMRVSSDIRILPDRMLKILLLQENYF